MRAYKVRVVGLNIEVADVGGVSLDELLAAHDYVAHEYIEGLVVAPFSFFTTSITLLQAPVPRHTVHLFWLPR
jgi:hypothetical protein